MIIKDSSWDEFYQSYRQSRLEEVLVFFFDRLRPSHLIVYFFLLFVEAASFSMLLMEMRLHLSWIWLSPFLMSHDYPSFAIIFNKLFFVLGVCRHDLLLESNNYRFKSPKLNQAFLLIIKQHWWKNTWSHLDWNMICLSHFINIQLDLFFPSQL